MLIDPSAGQYILWLCQVTPGSELLIGGKADRADGNDALDLWYHRQQIRYIGEGEGSTVVRTMSNSLPAAVDVFTRSLSILLTTSVYSAFM